MTISLGNNARPARPLLARHRVVVAVPAALIVPATSSSLLSPAAISLAGFRSIGAALATVVGGSSRCRCPSSRAARFAGSSRSACMSNDTVLSAAMANNDMLLPAAIRSEARGAVPSYNRVRLNDRKRTTGLRKQPVKTNENQSVIGLKASLRSAPRRSNIDLLPQDQNLGLKRSSRPEKFREHPPDQSHRSNITQQHHPILNQLPAGYGLRQGQRSILRSMLPFS